MAKSDAFIPLDLSSQEEGFSMPISPLMVNPCGILILRPAFSRPQSVLQWKGCNMSA